MKPIDLTKIIKKHHERKWVALSKDYKKVIAFDENLLALTKKIGKRKVIYMRVPPSDVFLTFSHINYYPR